jgi:hypothetical protein
MPVSIYTQQEMDEKLGSILDRLQAVEQQVIPEPLQVQFFAIRNDLPVIELAAKHSALVANFRQPVLAKFATQRILNCHSLEDIDAELSAISTSINYIAYDNEPNNGVLTTPSAELVNPGDSSNKAMAKIHGANFKAALAPSLDILVKELETVAWANADMLVMQLQRVTSTADFDKFVSLITSKVRAANPKCLLFAQVNTAFSTVEQILAHITAHRRKIDGISIVIQSDTDLAKVDELLGRLRQ